jgi:hypothetical protein
MVREKKKVDLLKRIKVFAYVLIGLAILILISGLLITAFAPDNIWVRFVRDFYANCVTSLGSIGIGVLVIDELRQRYGDETEKKRLISQMTSPHNMIATDAIRILRDRGWLDELIGKNFYYANLESAELYGANMSGSNFTYSKLKSANLNQAILDKGTFVETDLSFALLNDAKIRNAEFISQHSAQFFLKGADLFGADLTGTVFKGVASGKWMDDEQNDQLQEAKRLVEALMPDGKKYDGRYSLVADIEFAKNQGYDTNSSESMALFYKVPIKEYENGQKWYWQFGKNPSKYIDFV